MRVMGGGRKRETERTRKWRKDRKRERGRGFDGLVGARGSRADWRERYG